MVVFSVVPPQVLGIIFLVVIVVLWLSNRSGGDLLPWDDD